MACSPEGPLGQQREIGKKTLGLTDLPPCLRNKELERKKKTRETEGCPWPVVAQTLPLASFSHAHDLSVLIFYRDI